MDQLRDVVVRIAADKTPGKKKKGWRALCRWPRYIWIIWIRIQCSVHHRTTCFFFFPGHLVVIQRHFAGWQNWIAYWAFPKFRYPDGWRLTVEGRGWPPKRCSFLVRSKPYDDLFSAVGIAVRLRSSKIF